ncbi:MAG: PP2C family protein-serine/threonine phosphatase [Anaerolineae bacterium]|nr:PP2C family protein-serine/threonine phosphatase [Anaerolineae bacterium]
MAEDLKAAKAQAEGPPTFREKSRVVGAIGYQLAFSLLAFGLLLSRTSLGQLGAADWLLLLAFVLITVVCTELGFSLTEDIIVDLGGLFSGAAVLTLGFNGVWVPLLANVYSLVRTEWQRRGPAPMPQQVAQSLFNLGMNTLPPWLALFVYRDLLGGGLPLANLEDNLVPALAFVLVAWLGFGLGLLPLVALAQRGLKAAAQWFRLILGGLALTIYIPILFSPAVAVILNRLGPGFFLFISAGLLGISLMAQRLARSLAAERQRVEELTALNVLGSDIIHTLPGVEATGELLVRHTPRFVPGADFELCLFDPGRPDQRQVVVNWRGGAAQGGGDRPLTPPWAWLREHRETVHLARLDKSSSPFAWDEEIDGPMPASLLLVPLLAGDPASSEGEHCLGGVLMTRGQRDALAADVVPSVTALANQLAAALENARLHQEALARERLERELALARGIQTSFLPAHVPQVAGWSFAASLEPARQVSGDFYDFIPLSGPRLGLVIADVADKGMPAALYMALARTLIRAHAPDHPGNPAACLLAANMQILTDTHSDLFVTVFYGILNLETGVVHFANAGHNPPYLYSPDDGSSEALRNTGMALGVLAEMPLENGQVCLAPGDCLVCYSDGLVEAHDRDLCQFGSERLLAEIRAAAGRSAQQVQDGILSSVAAFVGDGPQFDDLTIVVVCRDSMAAGQREPT